LDSLPRPEASLQIMQPAGMGRHGMPLGNKRLERLSHKPIGVDPRACIVVETPWHRLKPMLEVSVRGAF
jgi:hypothetical protein